MSAQDHGYLLFTLLLVPVAALGGGCRDPGQDSSQIRTHRGAVTAYCTATVNGVGQVDVESDYLPHVVQCENGAASMEALKAQAVAARSYLYYKLDLSGSINDGTSDQVYSCGATPQPQHYQAALETAGQVLTYGGVTVCAFYVAGAIPSASSCVAAPGDNDYSNTEHYVTYNWNLSGSNIEQTTLGWVNPGNLYNRGCKSQNGADCLSDAGWGYQDILRFYYGMDIGIETAVGSCVTPTECTPGDTETESCDPCGTRTRSCEGTGSWGAWSACTGIGECTPGESQEEPCGDCGLWARTCQPDCTWSPWGSCESQPSSAPCSTGELGLCASGVYQCVEAQLVCVPSAEPQPELCDGLDDNCNGLVDEGLPGVLGDPPPPYAARLEILSLPASLEPDLPGSVRLRVENLGSEAWVENAVELRASAEGGGPSQLRAEGWIDQELVMRLGALAPGDSSELAFELLLAPDATSGLQETFRLYRAAGPGGDATPLPIACPSPAVTFSVSESGQLNAGLPDAGPDTQPVPRITTGCGCQAGGGSLASCPPLAPTFFLGLILLWLWIRLLLTRRSEAPPR